MSDRLAELSDDAAHEIRTALRESREGVLMAQKRIDILRKSPLVVNGTRASLETLRGKLGEAEELYITVFRQVNANYGDERAVGGRIMNKDQSGGDPELVISPHHAQEPIVRFNRLRGCRSATGTSSSNERLNRR